MLLMHTFPSSLILESQLSRTLVEDGGCPVESLGVLRLQQNEDYSCSVQEHDVAS